MMHLPLRPRERGGEGERKTRRSGGWMLQQRCETTGDDGDDGDDDVPGIMALV